MWGENLKLPFYRAGGSRTHTGFLPADFKSAASAISPPPLDAGYLRSSHINFTSEQEG